MNGPNIHLSEISYRNVKTMDKAILPVRQKKKVSQGSICAASKETWLMFAMLICNMDPQLLCA